MSHARPPRVGKVIVEGVNVAHSTTSRPAPGSRAASSRRPMPIDVSNVALVSPKDGKATRVGYRIGADGKKVRICRARGRPLMTHDGATHGDPAARSRTATGTRSGPAAGAAGAAQRHDGAPPREDRAQHGRRRRARRSRSCSRARWPTSRSSPGRSRSSPGPRSPSPASSCGRATPSAPGSRCGATACGSSSTG